MGIKLLNLTNKANSNKVKINLYNTATFVVNNIEIHVDKCNYWYKTA